MSEAEPTAKKQKVEADEAEEKEEKEEAKDDEKKADDEEVAEKGDAAEDADGVKPAELQHGDDGVAFLMLSPKKRLQLKKFKGQTLIDIREVYEKKGKTLPGKKGISLTVEQYEVLRDVISKGQIDEEIEKMKA